MPTATAPLRYTSVRPVTVVKINCGCGFRTNSLQEAEDHAVNTSHVLTIAGLIRKQ